MSGPVRTIVWLERSQVELMSAVRAASGLEVVGAGSPVKGQSAAVADALGTAAVTDLRAVLATGECELVLIGAPGLFGTDADDASALAQARARRVRVATLEPIPACALDLGAPQWAGGRAAARPVDAVRFIPLTRTGAAFRQVEQVLDDFGPIQSVVIEMWSRQEEGSLGARLFDALDLVVALLGEPETVDAVWSAGQEAAGPASPPGQSLRDLHGDLVALLRFGDGRQATLAASDRGGRWNRNVTLLGGGGRLRVYDDGFEWIGPAGVRVDSSRSATARRDQSPSPPHAVAAMADALDRWLDPAQPESGVVNHEAVHVVAQAALLSARTRHAESPEAIRRMVFA